MEKSKLEGRLEPKNSVFKSRPGGSRLSPAIRLRRRVSKHLTLKWDEHLGRPECPYMRRWVLALGLCSIRVHNFIRSDDARAFHDHPWWFATLVLRGGYTDVSKDEYGDSVEDHLRPCSVRFRRALHRHTVRVDHGGVWTLVLTGPNLRTWGFWVNGKFRKANKYFFEHGHHPCDQP